MGAAEEPGLRALSRYSPGNAVGRRALPGTS